MLEFGGLWGILGEDLGYFRWDLGPVPGDLGTPRALLGLVLDNFRPI